MAATCLHVYTTLCIHSVYMSTCLHVYMSTCLHAYMSTLHSAYTLSTCLHVYMSTLKISPCSHHTSVHVPVQHGGTKNGQQSEHEFHFLDLCVSVLGCIVSLCLYQVAIKCREFLDL